MPNSDARQPGGAQFDTGAVAVTDSSSWVQVGIISIGGSKRGGLVRIDIGASGAISHLKFTRACLSGGTHIDWIVDTDFNSAVGEIVSLSPASAFNFITSGPSVSMAVCLASICGTQEIGVWAKKTGSNTTTEVSGSFE